MAGGLNRNITVRLLADTGNFTAGMEKVGAESQKTATTMERTGGSANLITAGLAAAGIAAGALAAQAVGMAAEFDASMSTVQANTGASTDEMGLLRQAAIDAGASTVYSASDAADAINELGKAGVDTSDILSGGLSGALNLAASDGMEVGEAAELMSSAMAQFNLTGADAAKVADALAAGAGKAQGSARDLGYALQQSGMVASSYGISMEQTVGTLTAFANAGMVGSDAGTSLKTMLIALANPSDEAAGLMQELGINAYDAQGNFIGLDKLAGTLRDRLSGLSQEQRNQALATIFGSDAIRAANVLYSEGEQGIADWTRKVSDSGYAAEQAAAKNDNLKGDLENLSGSFESLMITLGEGAQGPLRSVVQTVDMVIDSFGRLPANVQQSIVLFTALAGGSAALHGALKPLNASGSTLARTLGLVIDPVQRLSGLGSGLAAAFQTWGATFGGAEKQIDTFGTTVSRKQGILTGFKAAGRGVLDLMGGPWGLALGAAGAAAILFADQAQKSRDRVDDLTESLKNGTDTFTYFEQALSKSEGSGFTDNGWIDDLTGSYDNLWQAVDKVGVSHETYIRAIQGDQDAIAQVTQAGNDYANSIGAWNAIWDNTSNVVVNGLKEQQDNYRQAKDAADSNTEAERLGTQASLDKTAALISGNDALTANTDASTEAADSNDILEASFGATKDAVNEASAALSEATDALNTYYGFAVSASDSTIALENAFDKASEAAENNGRTLDLDTEKGRNNQSALNDLAQAAGKAMDAHAKNGETLEQIAPILDHARDQFVTLAQKMGMLPDEAERAADAYGLNRDALERVAGQASTTGEATRNVGRDISDAGTRADDAAGRMDGLTGSITAIPGERFIDIEDNADDSRQRIGGVTQEVTRMPDGKWVTINVRDDASGVIRTIKDEIETIRSKTVTIRTNHVTNETTIRNGGSLVGRPGGYTGGLYDGTGFTARGYATGGIVHGLIPGTAPAPAQADNVILANARLRSGEFVTNEKAVKYYGADLYTAMNRMQVPRARNATPTVTNNVRIVIEGRGKSDQALAEEVLQTIRHRL